MFNSNPHTYNAFISKTLVLLLLVTAFIFNTNASCYKKDNTDDANPESAAQQAAPTQNNADIIYNEDGTVKQKTEISYKADGTTQTHKHVTTFTYYSNKKLKTKDNIGYEKGPLPVFREYAEYNETGNITKAENTTYKADGKTAETKVTYTYENGKPTEEVRYQNGVLSSKTQYTEWNHKQSSNLPDDATNHPSKKTVTTYNSDGSTLSTKQYKRNPVGIGKASWEEEI